MPKTHRLIVENIGQLATLANPAAPTRPRTGAAMRELGLIADAVMLVADGRIHAVGPRAEMRETLAAWQDAETTVVDAGGCLVTPGFVDAHTHAVFAGNRAGEYEMRIAGATYQQIAASGGGIHSTVRQTRAASEAELLAAARRHCRWMRRGGTTTIEAKSGYGLNLETELRMLRVLAALEAEGAMRVVPTVLAAHTVPQEFAEDRAGYLRLVVEEILPAVVAGKLARYCDVFCDDHAFTVDETRQVLTAAAGLGLGLRIHAEQFRPGTGAALAAELGAATADHLEMLDEATMPLLARAGVQPVLLPASVFCLSRSQYPPARQMIDAGLGVVLATDFNPGSSPAPSMAFTMSLACLQMRMTPAEALTAATHNAACSLGLGGEVGALAPGMVADFLVHGVADVRELAYFVAAPLEPRVFLSGREVFGRGGLDVEVTA